MIELSPQSHYSAKKILGDDQYQKWIMQLPHVFTEIARNWNLEFVRSIPEGTRGAIILCKNENDLIALKIPFDQTTIVQEHQTLLQTQQLPLVQFYRYSPEAIATYFVQGETPDKYTTKIPDPFIEAFFERLQVSSVYKLPSVYEDVKLRLEIASQRLNENSYGLSLNQGHIDRAKDLARDLDTIADDKRVFVHGDLHVGNLIQTSYGLIACDPKGAWGDGSYDAAMFALKASRGTDYQKYFNMFCAMGFEKDRLEAWTQIIALHELIAYMYHNKSQDRKAEFEALAIKI